MALCPPCEPRRAHARPGAGARAGDRRPARACSGVPGGQGAGRGRARVGFSSPR